MKRLLSLVIALIFLLSACRAPLALPSGREPRGIALASVLAFSRDEAGALRLLAAAETGTDAPLTVFEGGGVTVGEAMTNCRARGNESISFSHVEHLVLEERFAEESLPQLLALIFQKAEQSVESKLWILREGGVDALFPEGGDLPSRLETLRQGSENGAVLPMRSLRAITAQWADDGAALIPALRIQDGVPLFDSYALFREGKLQGYIEDAAARGCALLFGENIQWTENLDDGNGGFVTVELRSKGSSVWPVIRNGSLAGLRIRCAVRAVTLDSGVQGLEKETTARALAAVKWDLEAAIEAMRQQNADAVGMRRKAGLHAPWAWDIIQNEWSTHFASVPVDIEVVHKPE